MGARPRPRLTVVVVATLFVGSLLALGLAAPAGAPSCQGYTLTLTFNIYAGKAQIVFNGVTYSNGQTAAICVVSGGSYSLSASNIAQGYSFYQWFTSTKGQFGNPYASSTVFVAPTSTGPLSGALTLVLNRGGLLFPYDAYGGYTISGSTATKITGSFTVPGQLTYVAGATAPNEVAFGAGIGGIFGNGWWTLLVVQVSSSGSLSFFQQDWTVAPSRPVPLEPFDSPTAIPQARAGDTFDITIQWTPGSPTGTINSLLCDRTQGGCYGENANIAPIDLSTDEWFGIDLRDCGGTPYNPPVACHAVPRWSGPLKFTVPTPQGPGPNLVGSAVRTTGTGVDPPLAPEINPGYLISTNSFGVCYAQDDCVLRLTNNAATSTGPTVATDSSGNYHVVWVDSRDGNNEIYYKKLDPSWNVLVSDTRLTANSGDSAGPAITVSSSGTITVVWSDNRGGKYDLYRKQYTSSWGADTKITTSGALGYDAKEPDVVVDSSSVLYYVWRDVRRTPTEEVEHVYLRVNDGADNVVYQLNGAALAQTHNDRVLSPRVAVGNGGAIHVVYSKGPAYPVETGTSYMYYSREGVNPLDLTLGTNSGTPRPMSVDADQASHVYAAWHLYGGSAFDVAFRKSDNGGSTWSTTKTFGGSNNQIYPDVARGPNGKLFVFWADNGAGQYEIYYATSADYGGTWSASKRVTNALQDSTLPRAAVSLTDGKVGLVWRDARDGNTEVYFVGRFL